MSGERVTWVAFGLNVGLCQATLMKIFGQIEFKWITLFYRSLEISLSTESDVCRSKV